MIEWPEQAMLYVTFTSGNRFHGWKERQDDSRWRLACPHQIQNKGIVEPLRPEKKIKINIPDLTRGTFKLAIIVVPP